MKYIEAFREGDKINEVYLCKYKQAATAKNGKAYENVILQIGRASCRERV